MMFSLSQFFQTHPHPRLLIAVSLGLCSGLIMPRQWHLVTQFLVAWNMMVWSYLGLMAWLMLRADHARTIKIANQEDEHGATILAMFSIATVASIGAIVLELSGNGYTQSLPIFHYLLTVATIFGSWFFIGVLFTFHYSRMYYTSPSEQRSLKFPDSSLQPDYWDFLYFSFTIAVAAQTADVSVTSRAMRKAVLAQSILSFLFNVAIIGLSINVMASLLD